MAGTVGSGDPGDVRHAPDLEPGTLATLSQVALDAAVGLGASHAELRIERIRSQAVSLRDARLETATDDTRIGMGLRVVHGGAVGFAATVALGPQSAAALATHAVALARTCARAGGDRVEPAPEPPHGTVSWTSPHRVDPVDVPLATKISLLEQRSARLLDHPIVDHVTAGVLAVSEEKHYADLAGTTASQRRVRVHPQISALTLTDGGMEELRTLAPPVGRGWEYLDGDGWDWEGELAELPDLLAQKVGAPSVGAGTYDLVIDPTNLWLTIHESIGHATELDRAMGYEAAYAGTSFATLDQLGRLRYGSPLLHVVADRTSEHGLATVAIDDEGVRSQSFDLIRDGMLVGYQLDRATAARAGLGSSNGCSYADSPLHIPIQRMANVSLQPAPGPEPGPSLEELIAGVEHGIYVIGDKSWSIDMQRYNFQFTGQRFFRIEHGRLAGQVRDVAYQSTTTDFWGSMVAVGGRSTYLLAGAFNCGKGQPGQVAPVSHGSPAAVFEGVRVLNTREEGAN
ncbi:MAG: TldD/PmbA family protein [Acidimicrobiales bacterium]